VGDDLTSMIRLTTSIINSAELVRFVSDPNHGAFVLFLGTIRKFTLEKETKSVEYEAYEPMAVSVLEQIEAQAVSQFKIGKVSIVHRLGKCLPEEVAVAVAVSSSHRRNAFDACSWIMDEIKRVVPIWKLETDGDDVSTWIHPQSNSI